MRETVERADRGDTRPERKQARVAAQRDAQQRKRQVEHFFDRQRPQHAQRVVDPPVSADQHVHPERQRREIHEPQRHGDTLRRVIHEDRHAGRHESVDDREQQEQARHDACDARHVERAHVDRAEAAPSAARIRRDQIAGDHEEHRHAVVAVAHHRMHGIAAERARDGRVAQRVRNIEVMQQDEQDRYAAQQVDPCVARAGAHCGRPGSASAGSASRNVSRARRPAFGVCRCSSWIR